MLNSFEFTPAWRPPDKKLQKARAVKAAAARKKLIQVQAAAAKGKQTLQDVEAAAETAFSLESEAEAAREGHIGDSKLENRLAKLRFHLAYQTLDSVLDDVLNESLSMKKVEAALRSVHQAMSPGQATEPQQEKKIAAQLAIIRAEVDQRRQAKRNRDAQARKIRGLEPGENLSEMDKFWFRRKTRLSQADDPKIAIQEFEIARRRANLMEMRASEGTASIKQVEAALKAEALALRRVNATKMRSEIHRKVSESIRQTAQVLARQEREKAEAEREKQEQKKKLELQKSRGLKEAKRLKQLGVERIEEWRLVQAPYDRESYWGVIKVDIGSNGTVAIVRSSLHRLTESHFGRDNRILPIASKEVGREELHRLLQSLTTGSPAGGFESGLASAVFHEVFTRELFPRDEIINELAELSKAFDKPVISYDLVEAARPRGRRW